MKVSLLWQRLPELSGHLIFSILVVLTSLDMHLLLAFTPSLTTGA